MLLLLNFQAMKKNSFRISILFLFYMTRTDCYSQEWLWAAAYNGFFDNREYFNEYVMPQTMFGAHFSAYTGFSLNETHEFCAGIDALYEFGDSVRGNAFRPVVFYHFKNDLVNLILGSHPRKGLIDLPNFLLSDTLLYYRPNVEGIYLELSRPWGFQQLWLDWTSRQTDYTRETFKIGGTGMLRKGMFFYRHDFIMTHYAGPAIPIPDDHIRDNGGLYSGVGINLSGLTSLDTLIISSGLCFSYDRLRNVYDLEYKYGSMTQLMAEIKGFGVKITSYFGDGQVQMNGDGLYKAPLYNRFDFYWRIFRKRAIYGKVEFSLHLIDNILDTSQAFTISADIGGGKKLKQN